jgi:2-keto-3-deoxy-6-phosphogluconate aldolase
MRQANEYPRCYRLGARHPRAYPGVMTPTEVISARNSNFSVLKLFPAEQAGGVGILRTFGLAIPGVQFCSSALAERLGGN